ncbi:MAG: Rossmann-fold NAD(P)-binding domain-containing protein, partial [Planctomycetota bacterium]
MAFNVFVTRKIPQAGLDLLARNCRRVDLNPNDRMLTRDELLDGVRNRDGVLSLLTDTIDDEILAAAGQNCKVFANYAVGYNNIDVPAATRRGIMVTNTPGVLTETTADLAWALMLT